MTFLELVQRACQDSGLIPNSGPPGQATALPTSISAALTASPPNMTSRMVGWVRDAWLEIQSAREDWKWLREEFTATMTIGQARYNGDDLGLTRGDLNRWKLYADDGRTRLFTVYYAVDDTASELFYLPYNEFHRNFVQASIDDARPASMSVDDAGKLCFAPAPSIAYTLRGTRIKDPQVLTLDADVPEMPATFHDLIWQRALFKADVFDEAGARLPVWADQHKTLMARLHDAQMPSVTIRQGEFV